MKREPFFKLPYLALFVPRSTSPRLQPLADHVRGEEALELILNTYHMVYVPLKACSNDHAPQPPP